jgi:hypothetical protein
VSDSDDIPDYDSPPYDSDDSGGATVASTMLPPGASPGSGKSPKKKKGKGAKLAPKKFTSSGVSQTPIQEQTRAQSEEISITKDGNIDLSHDAAMNMVSMAYIKAMDGNFAKLYLKIDNLKTEVSTLKTTVASLVKENNKLGEVRRNAPDPEKQPPVTPRTPVKDLTIRPAQPPALRRRVEKPLARKILKQNLVKQVESDNAMPMSIDESDVEPRKPG